MSEEQSPKPLLWPRISAVLRAISPCGLELRRGAADEKIDPLALIGFTSEKSSDTLVARRFESDSMWNRSRQFFAWAFFVLALVVGTQARADAEPDSEWGMEQAERPAAVVHSESAEEIPIRSQRERGSNYDPHRAGHPLRIVAYVLHPIGVTLDYLIFRPAYWLGSHEPLKTLFGVQTE